MRGQIETPAALPGLDVGDGTVRGASSRCYAGFHALHSFFDTTDRPFVARSLQYRNNVDLDHLPMRKLGPCAPNAYSYCSEAIKP
jgi:hypothetical protein